MTVRTKILRGICATLVAALLVACAPHSRPGSPLTGEEVLRAVHDRYAGRRFTHVTFVQTTVHGDGRIETWYEALAPMGRVRVDIAPLASRNGFMYRGDSQYVFRNGSLVERHPGQKWLSILILLDMFAMPLDAVLARASELGLNLAAAHASRWNSRDVYVAGAYADDTLSPQVWFDREHLYPVRLIQRAWANPTVYDWHISNHLNIGGGWIEREILLFSGGRLLVRETYDSITPRQSFPDSLFIPEPYRPPEWVRGASGAP